MNKTFFKSILFVGLAVCMFSCKDDNSPLDGGNTPQGVNVEFDYSQAKLSRDAGSSATLNGSSDVDWTIEVEEGDFFSVEPMSGTAGDFKLTVTATKANTLAEKQYSKFIFNASGRKYPITVIHLEDNIRLEVSGPAGNVFTFDTDGGTNTFNVTANTEWIVKTMNAEDWIHFDETNVGKIGENMEVKVSVDPNPFAKVREGKFEVRVPESTSNEYTVTQNPAPLEYTIKDKNTDLTTDGLTELGGGGDTRTITLNANADWKIVADSWLTFEPSEGVASLEPVEVTMNVAPNPNMNPDGERSGSFTVTFGDGNSVSESVEINVKQNKGEMPDDAKKLKELEEELEGDNTDALNWSSVPDYTQWTGVDFDENGNLIGLYLSGKGLKGYIPAGISKLTSLRVLDLSNNNLIANPNLPEISIKKSSTGSEVSNTQGIPFDQSYKPAIPVGIKNLVKLEKFKLSGNKIEGTFPSDVVNNPNYLNWGAMENIYPQQGDDANISYNSDSPTRYVGADPSAWKFKLTQIGVLRVMYHAMGGENWKDKELGNDEPAWLNREFVIAQDKGAYPSGNNPRVTAVSQIGANQDVQKFEVGNVSGYVPEECLMNSGLAHLWVDGTDANFKLTGSIHPLIIQRLNYLQFKNHDLDMNVNFIFANLRSSVSNIAFQNNAKIDGTINISLLTDAVENGKLSFGSFILTGTGIQGTVSVAAIKPEFRSADQDKVTVEGLQAKFPATVNVTE